jgi:hypothetical protein
MPLGEKVWNQTQNRSTLLEEAQQPEFRIEQLHQPAFLVSWMEVNSGA